MRKTFMYEGRRYKVLRVEEAKLVLWAYTWTDVLARPFTYEQIRRFA